MSEKKAKYLVVDTESTGLIPGRHGLVQLACVVLDESLEVMHSLCTDICPPEGYEIDPRALKVNGFTKERIVQGVGYPQIAKMFLDFLNQAFAEDEEPIMVGQFYPADYSALMELIKYTGQTGIRLHEKLGNSVLDTKALVNTLNLKAELNGQNLPFPITSLSKPGGVKDVLGVTQYQAHDAMGDVLATREVLIKLLEKFETA
jgi:DNA polymerase III epsilon subunit-like protein